MNSFEPKVRDVDSAGPAPELIAAMERYLGELEAGRIPDARAFAKAYPEIADELLRCVQGLEFVHEAAAPLSDAGNVDRGSYAPGQDAVSPASDVALETLGDFRLIRELGRGGMGVVYEAHQISLNRRVALKILPFAAVLDSRQLKRFKNEAQAAAMLKHPHIVSVYSVGCERGVHYYAMELVEGLSLAEVIQAVGGSPETGGPTSHESQHESSVGRPDLPPPASGLQPVPDTQPIAALSTERTQNPRSYYRTVARLGIEAAQALDHAHQMGVVHRDIKPSNLLLDHDGHLWITDFGLAATQSGTTNLTKSGDLLGTLRYMSPEQASGRRGVVDHRTDIYSLAVTLYELITLHSAVEGQDRQELFRAIEEREPKPPHVHNPAVPGDLETIVLKAMAKQLADRYPSAHELAADLQRFLDDKPIHARRASRTGRVWRWSRRNPLVTVLLAMLFATMTFLSLAGPLVAIRQHRLAEVARKQTYNLSVNAAWRAWHDGATGQIEELLAAQIPRPGQFDYRDFAWHHLWGRYHRALETPTLTHPAEVTNVIWSADGKKVITACDDKVVRLWDAAQLTMEREFKGNAARVNALAVSPDGGLIACGGEDDLIKLWDAKTAAEVATLDQNETVRCLAFALNGRVLVSAGDDGKVIFWNVEVPASPQEMIAITAHDLDPETMAVSPDGRQAATGGYDRKVMIWAIPTGDLIKVIDDTFVIYSLVFSPDGRFLAVGSNDVTLWETETWSRVGRFHTGDQQVGCVAFSPDSRYLITPAFGRLSVWNIESQRRVGTIGEAVGYLSLCPKEPLVAIVVGRAIQLWPVSYPLIGQWSAPQFVRVRIVRDDHGLWILVGCGQMLSSAGVGSFAVYDARSLERRYVLEDLPPVLAIDHCVARPNLVALAGGVRGNNIVPGQVLLVDLRTGKRLGSLLGSSGQCYAVAFSTDGSKLAASPVPNLHFGRAAIDVWNVDTRQLIQSLPGFFAFDLDYTPDDRFIVAGGRLESSASLARFNSRVLNDHFTTKLPSPWITTLAIHPDGDRVASINFFGHITFWDTQQCRELYSTQSPSYRSFSVCYSPDGNVVAAGGLDGWVKQWDANSGEELATLRASGAVTSVCFSDDGQILAAGCTNKTATIWYLDGRCEVLKLDSISK